MSQPPPPPPSGDPQYPSYNPQNQPQQPGQSPYGQQPGYQPYGQQYPPNPYAVGGGGPTPPKSHTTRNILIIVAVLVVLFCGGITTAIIVLVNNADDAFDSAFDTEYEGSEDDPLEVSEGDSFSIRGFDYDEGWSITTDPTTEAVEIENLVATNNRDDEESYSLYLTFSFYQGGQGVGELTCSSQTTVRYEKKSALNCNGYDIPTDYDTIEVWDNATFE